jgi:hypothetical protein
LLSSSEHSGVPEDSKSQLFQVLGFTPTLGQSGVATLSARGTALTSFMNEDRVALINFCRFVAPKEPDCLLCCVYGNAGNVHHPSQNCSLLLDGRRCFKCLGPHPKSDCCNSIPRSPDVCPKCHLSHNGHALGNVPLHEGRYDVDCPG